MRRFGLCLLLFAVAAVGFGAGVPVAGAEPPTTHEIIYNRPSGFWTSNRPALNGAYRYRLLAIGAGIVLVTGVLTLRLIKRANAARAQRG